MNGIIKSMQILMQIFGTSMMHLKQKAMTTESTPYCKDIANQCGFIRFDNYFCDFPSRVSYDLEDFVKAVLGTPEEEFMEMYENYPLVREKYTIVQKIIADMGFIF